MDLQKSPPRLDAAFRQVVTAEDRQHAVTALDLFNLPPDRLDRLEENHNDRGTYAAQVILSAIEYVRRARLTVN